MDLLQHEQQPAKVPLSGSVTGVLLSLASTTVLTLFFTQRGLAIKNWGRLPFVVWLVFAIYLDSYLFVFATAILQHSLGVNTSFAICEAAILLCLLFYVTTKIVRITSLNPFSESLLRLFVVGGGAPDH
ncbi:hypothetical protein ESCO_003616 [Escovopsis weberi]|uniref:Uncharacterized protein n=1 Tax=Escovopsis weberi TaxID=150374 RepID=A0A0M8N9T1_ESCWE|nr:hypothetical protein ESCO_003616 [Escovopsis weberi]